MYNNTMTDWFQMLADARGRLGLTQGELAARAHISPSSLRAYECGRRHPSRPYLGALLDVLKVDRVERSKILAAAGYATDSFELGPWVVSGFMFTLDEAVELIAGCRWPAFVANEMMELSAANGPAQRLWSVDLRTEFLEPGARNLLSVASNPRFAARCANLPEILEIMAAVFKGHHRGSEALESPSPYFAAVLDRFLAGEPRYIQPFLEAWQAAVPRTPKIRWEYPVAWDDPDVGTLRFRGIVGPASEPDGLSLNDWIPLDAETWIALNELERLRR